MLKYYRSVIIKLRSAEHHANNILTTSGIVHPSSMFSGGTSSTLSVINVTGSATSSPSITDEDIHRELDDFFFNLFSVFESFAQVVNLVYINPPLADRNATYIEISKIMTTRFRFPIEQLTPYLTFLQTQEWFKDMRKFRKCTTHSESVPFRFSWSRQSMSLAWEPKIILPDNPRSSPLAYTQNREFDRFGINMLTEVFEAIEIMFKMLDDRIKSADKIPVY